VTTLRKKVLAAALKRANRWRGRPGVLAVGLGQRRRLGHWVRGETCVVVKVPWKLDPSHLRKARQKALDAWIVVTVDGRKHRVAVDVQETRGDLVGRCQGCAGGAVRIAGQLRGAVGPVVSDAGATKIMISGHVGKRAGVSLSAGGVNGTTEAPAMTTDVDACLVLPGQTFPANGGTLVDGSALAGVAPVAELTVDQTLFFQRAATGARTAAVLRHLDIGAPFQYPDGVHALEHLIATDGVTVDGDSGTLLYDASFRAVGTLVGLFGNESYFVPCERSFGILGLGLVT